MNKIESYSDYLIALRDQTAVLKVGKDPRRYYIQSAYQLQDAQKEEQEKRSLLQISDSFKKILVVSGHYPPMLDNNGIVTIGVFRFLSNPSVIDSL